MYKYKCEQCSKNFESKLLRVKYCNLECKYNSQGERQVKTVCIYCNKDFYYLRSVKKTGTAKFCSRPCKTEWARKPENRLNKSKVHYEKNVIKNKEGCWGWNGSFVNAGYGQSILNNRTIHASRMSWIIHNGQIPEGLWVLHKCDNPPCTNPQHLFLGNSKDNTQDMIKKGRKYNCKGSDVHFSKLNEEQVKQIRIRLSNGEKAVNLSKEFGINQAALSAIKHKRTWKHVV